MQPPGSSDGPSLTSMEFMARKEIMAKVSSCIWATQPEVIRAVMVEEDGPCLLHGLRSAHLGQPFVPEPEEEQRGHDLGEGLELRGQRDGLSVD